MTASIPIRAAIGTTAQALSAQRHGLQQNSASGQVAKTLPPGSWPDARSRAEAPPLRFADEAAEVRAIARGTVQAAMEVLAGIRPVHQLARRLDPKCLSTLQHRAALIRHELVRTGNPDLARLHRNSMVRSIRVCGVGDGIYEASAVVIDDVRVRAVAVRLERSKQVWRVTELMVG
ncbi:Rv3235 family protein [Arthrobacter sp. ZBG10]|uniref:Rv3235 family protein n=1 Tax=Arthrobacter sp. ZBG10 TaxID=1676590 RepID=UPI000682DB62|nr:Rv3235 family protein [Arthrobacter sp. ZBG10]